VSLALILKNEPVSPTKYMSIHCHGDANIEISGGEGGIALVGHPNVGKSVIFQRLTGQRVMIANYPGTTIEVGRGRLASMPEVALFDTPGVVAFPPHSEDERITLRVLFDEPVRAIVQVGEAKNLRRTLLLTTQLLEMGLPVILVLNMMDEAVARKVSIDIQRLEQYLRIQVIPTVAVRGAGMDDLLASIQQPRAAVLTFQYHDSVEKSIGRIKQLFPKQTPIAARALALLWLSGDETSEGWLQTQVEESAFQTLLVERARLAATLEEPISILIQKSRLQFVDEAIKLVMSQGSTRRSQAFSWLDRLTTHPIWGFILLGVVLFGLYWFVGILGAGTLVDVLESHLFGRWLNPWMTSLVRRFIPLEIAQQFIVGEYGLWTMGVTYALALILPIVTTFFLAFGVLEDSGYLPRLVAFSNRWFIKLGLNGRAILPMVLGLGCVTMATMTTRVLESKRERLLVTLLLALAIPCSAQLGVVMGMLAGISLTATLTWAGIVLLVLLVVGWLAAHLVPGERIPLMTELPPLRLPLVSNVVMKTLARLEWYLKEVLPLFLLGTAILFVLDKTGVLGYFIRLSKPVVTGWLGLPAEASAAFLIGFLRRDFAATNLFVMQNNGLLTPTQVIVAMVTITLFIPCVASVMMIARERGWRTAAGLVCLVFPIAITVGGLLDKVLIWIG